MNILHRYAAYVFVCIPINNIHTYIHTYIYDGVRYDDFTLFSGHWNPSLSINTASMQPVLGAKAVRRFLGREMRLVHEHAGLHCMHGAPTLIGECGIPYNMKDKHAYRTGDYTKVRDRES